MRDLAEIAPVVHAGRELLRNPLQHLSCNSLLPQLVLIPECLLQLRGKPASSRLP